MAENNQLQIIEKSLAEVKNMPEVLKKNQSRSEKGVLIGHKILQMWEQAEEVEDEDERQTLLEEADAKSNKYLVSIRTAGKEMKDERSPYTQLLTTLSKYFTQAEADVNPAQENSIPYQVQQKRNKLATMNAERERLRQLAAEQKRAKDEAKIALRASMTSHIATSLNAFTAEKKTKMTSAFNSITLETYDKMQAALNASKTEFPKDKQGEIVHADWDIPSGLTQDDVEEQLAAAHMDYDYDGYYEEYKAQVQEHKQYLIDRLPSKKQELLDAKAAAEEADRKQKEMEKAAAEAERIRQEEIAKSKSKAEKDRLQAEADRKKQEDQKKIDDAKKQAEQEEADRLQKIKDREKEENDKLQQQLADSNKKDADKIDLKQTEAKTLSMFDQMSDAAEVSGTAQVKSGVTIEIQHPSGWMLVVAFYFEQEGRKLGIDELGRKTLDQMKKACETIALKTNNKISSPFVVYKEVFKAVNKK